MLIRRQGGLFEERHDLVENRGILIARPAVATGRLALTAQGLVRYTLKTPYRDGTTHVILEPLDFMARLAALVPRPRVHLTRYHGVLAPHSSLRAQVTPAGRGKRIGATERSPAERHRAMSWAKRLKRVFRIEIDTCERCGGKVRIIVSIEDPAVAETILAHLAEPEGARRGPAGATVNQCDCGSPAWHRPATLA